MSSTARRLIFVAALALVACHRSTEPPAPEEQIGSSSDRSRSSGSAAGEPAPEEERELSATERSSDRLVAEGVRPGVDPSVPPTIVVPTPEPAAAGPPAPPPPVEPATLGVVGGAVGGGGDGLGTGTAGIGTSARGYRGQAYGGIAAAPGHVRGGERGERDHVGSERYEHYGENEWTAAADDALATFSIDVDTASYSLARSSLNSASLPQPASIRVEEFVNAFDYGYAPPASDAVPFALDVELAPSRFGEGLDLLRVGIQGYETDPADRMPANLVFLVDTSGSMQGPDRLGLVKYSLSALLSALGPDDTLSIVTYAGTASVALAPTRVSDRASIRAAIDRLEAGGSTNGADGIRTAYELARSVAIPGGTNRVIWCSDGDLNVGMTGDALLAYIEENGRNGVALTTLGFGRGNYNDRDMERFANRGDGNYHFIDDRNEALRVLGDELMGTLEVIARDVKIQVEVNPDVVQSYRLIGYENRDVADADFRNDAVDAGEIGSGHSVTALLELQMRQDRVITRNERVATVRVRYELPDEEGEGREVETSVYTHERVASFEQASGATRLAAAVAEFAEVLRRAENATGSFDAIEGVIRSAAAPDDLQVEELAALVTQARALWR